MPINTSIQKQLVISDRMFTKLRYTEIDVTRTNINIAFNTAVTTNTYFANNPYLHFTGQTVPSTPGLFEWGTFYARYRVHAIKVKAYFVSNDATTADGTAKPLMALVHLQSDPAPNNFTTWAQVQALDANRYTTMKPLAITQNGGQVQPTFIKRYYNLSQVNGNKLAYKVDDTFEGTTGSVPGGGAAVGPLRLFNYYLSVMTMDGSAVTVPNGQNVSVNLRTTFYIEFKDRFDVLN